MNTASMTPSAYELVAPALRYDAVEIAIMARGALGRDYSGPAAALAVAAALTRGADESPPDSSAPTVPYFEAPVQALVKVAA